MSNTKKRAYHSAGRKAKAEETRKRILNEARSLFKGESYELVTIEKIAKLAEVSSQMIYLLFQSKQGLLRALMDEAYPSEQFNALVEAEKKEKSPRKRLAISASMARRIYDAEHEEMNLFKSAAILGPELKALEAEKEARRYMRQEESVRRLFEEKHLKTGLTLFEARDLIWAYTGRDMYRMLVIERGWSPDAYEAWLAQALVHELLGR